MILARLGSENMIFHPMCTICVTKTVLLNKKILIIFQWLCLMRDDDTAGWKTVKT